MGPFLADRVSGGSAYWLCGVAIATSVASLATYAPDQPTPEQRQQIWKSHACKKARGDADTRKVLSVGPMIEAFRTATANPHARALVASMTRTFGQPPVQLRTLGGTVPIAPFIDALGFPALLVPTVNFDNNQHEENENLRLGHFFQSIEIIAAVLRM